MVGENYFSAVTLTSRLIRETPSVEEQISFQPGDVVGFLLTTNHNNPQDRGVVLDTTYSSEIVWYGSTDGVHTRPDCPFPVGSETNRFLRSSTNAAPVISVSTCKNLYFAEFVNQYYLLFNSHSNWTMPPTYHNIHYFGSTYSDILHNTSLISCLFPNSNTNPILDWRWTASKNSPTRSDTTIHGHTTYYQWGS